ncbi:LCP family protein [Natroniella sulfidigena]|uniref:LCP family protein n=1 Tax=Natroniella sulfidigena TaxID=723921 RepID=UPI00200B19BC|nr:LCP family protein [Natroniella sulfidigena]MCK8815899.1 LCP family protein [Natroniella sulfidigena]
MPRKNRWTSYFLVVVAILLIGGVNLVTFHYLDWERGLNNIEDEDKTEVGIDAEELEERINILVLGIDAEADENKRSDTLLLVSLDLTTNEVGVISIPRDTRVKLADRDSYHKINAAYAYGGVDLTRQTVEEFLDISIDHYLKADYQGFIDVVDALGGVELDIEEDLYYVDRADDLYIDLKAGTRKLDGEDALKYVRFRDSQLGDIGRVQRQQEFLRATVDQLLNPQTIFRLPGLIREVNDAVMTDLKLTDKMQLTGIANQFSLEQVQMELLPGIPDYISGISYWVPLEREIELLVDAMFNKRNYFNNQELDLVIMNGNGEVGRAQKVAELLSVQGYNIQGVRNADRFDYSQTAILSPNKEVEEIEELANYLDGELLVEDEISTVKVIVGKSTNFH